MSTRPSETVVVASWIEPELVERMRAVDPGVEVLYEPDLLRKPRYAADHKGQEATRSEAEEARWRALLAKATILFDFDITHRKDLPDLIPSVRWIQATSSGIGQLVRQLEYDKRMPDTVFTTARGVHAQPLAEFAVMGMLLHSRRGLDMIREQGKHAWERFAGTDLQGRTLLIVGLGAIGTRLAKFAKVMGMEVLAIKRNPHMEVLPDGVDSVFGLDALGSVLPKADFVVMALPHTDETEGLMGARQFQALPKGAAFINVGRGASVNEPELVAALESGHLGGAYLDVFATEPLPEDSPLWDMPNVMVSPHSGSTSDRENERITDVFCENIARYRAGEPLINVLDTSLLY